MSRVTRQQLNGGGVPKGDAVPPLTLTDLIAIKYHNRHFVFLLLLPCMYSCVLTCIEDTWTEKAFLFQIWERDSILTGKQTISVLRMTSTLFSAFYKPINESFLFFNLETARIENVL